VREVSIDLSKKADSSQDCEEGGGGGRIGKGISKES